jgi:hypothetical protein
MDANVEVVRHLENELHLTRTRNPAYSLRALSRRIGVVPSALSDLIRGKRKVTRKMADRILSALEMVPEERDRLLSQIPQPRTRITIGSPDNAYGMPGYTKLDLTRNHVVLDWFCFAIVSLAETRDFQEDPEWIASRLGIQSYEARSALRKLEQVGIMIRDKKGKLKYSHSNVATPTDIPDYAIRKRHQQHLELAAASLENHDVLERDFSSISIATSRKKLKEAKKRIRRFRRSLCAFLESDEKEDVFLLNIQLFPLTQKRN